MPPGQAYHPPPILGQKSGMVATRQTVPSAVDQSTINSLVSDHLSEEMVRRVTLKEKVQRTLNSRDVKMQPGLMQAVVKDNLTKSY